MKWIAPLLCLLLLPIVALARPVNVASGEHEGYTRLVFTISPDKEWELVKDGATAKLLFPMQTLAFADEAVFERIPKSRLANTSWEQQEDAALYSMELGCDCDVSAFPYLDSYLVVDIADRAQIPTPARRLAPGAGSTSRPDNEGGMPAVVPWIPPMAPSFAISPHQVNFPPKPDGVGLSPTQTPDDPPSISSAEPVRNATSDEMVEIGATDQGLQAAVDVARHSLLQQLTLAADQGFLELREPKPDPLLDAEPTDLADPVETVKVLIEDIEAPIDVNQMSIQTAAERDFRSARGEAENQSHNCPDPMDLDIASWGSGTDFSGELSSARQNMLQEFDEPNFGEIEKLVQTYLRYGFGAEAKGYLLEHGQNIEQTALLLDLAAIVDGYPAKIGGPLSKAIACDGIVGLWALVGAYPTTDTNMGDDTSIVEAFADLPPDIRQTLGPRLVAAFLDRGLDALARQVSNILERAPGTHGAAHELTVGNLEMIEGSESEAESRYQGLANEGSSVAVDALMELATLKLEKGEDIPEHLLLDIGLNAKIWRGTQKGGELRRLEALWLARSGRETSAIDLLAEEARLDPENAGVFRKTAEEILSALSTAENPKDDFAQIIHNYKEFIPEDIESDRLRLEIASSLLLAGLPDFAIDILKPVLRRNVLDAKLLSAKANMRAYRPKTALSLLEGIEGDDARNLRIEAYMELGEFGSALEQLRQSTEIPEATVLARWFKSDLETAINENAAAAEIRDRFLPYGTHSMAGSTDITLDLPPTLSSAQRLLADSLIESEKLAEALSQR